MAAAQAAEHTVVAENYLYLPPVVVVEQGDTLMFQNRDSAPHNIAAQARRAAGPNGRMFMSATIRSTAAAPNPITEVVGVDATPPGAYNFYCTVHPQMNGVLVVTPAS